MKKGVIRGSFLRISGKRLINKYKFKAWARIFMKWNLKSTSMMPLGHFAVSYFTVNLLKQFIDEDYNILLVWFISILPDFDIVLSSLIIHRGPTHSIVSMSVLFIPFYLYYKRGFNYFVALLTHSLLGDYFTFYGIQLFWPLNKSWYVASQKYLLSTVRIDLLKIEIVLFFLMIIHLRFTRYRINNSR